MPSLPTPALPALTTAQMIEVDRLMIEEFGIQLLQMMENAGRNLADHARHMLGGQLAGRRIVVLCGAGNNGGGGMAAARHLHNWGAQVQALLAADESRLRDAPGLQWRALLRLGAVQPGLGTSAPPDLVIDAILGYGLQGNPRPAAARWIEWANTQGCPILALDAPSGLDTTTGTAGQPCIRATSTLTLALPNTGLLAYEARLWVGQLWVADISVPPGLYQRLGFTVGPIFATAPIIRVY